MDELKETIAGNLVHLRTQAKLTQLQLAEMLNYSDKAVSKWERGEAIPDLRVLIQLSELYGITVDDIISPHTEKKVKPKMNIGTRRILITLLSVGLVWFIATVFFTVLYFIPKTADYAYLVFTVAPFVSSVTFTVFAAIWWNRFIKAVACSLTLWTFVVIFHIFVITFSDFTKIFILYIVASVFEVLIILWFILKRISKRKK